MKKSFITALIACFYAASPLKAQDQFCKVWYTSERDSKVEIFTDANGKYCGKLVWLKNGIVDGKPLTDKKNPDAAKRNQTWLGLQILNGLTKKSETELVDGKIYDPSHGNYYNCKMTLHGKDKLVLRGYILGIPFLGKTTTWYLAEEQKTPTRIPVPTSTPVKSSVYIKEL
jgi:uncharacterized protein (DUF2147 family)